LDLAHQTKFKAHHEVQPAFASAVTAVTTVLAPRSPGRSLNISVTSCTFRGDCPFPSFLEFGSGPCVLRRSGPRDSLKTHHDRTATISARPAVTITWVEETAAARPRSQGKGDGKAVGHADHDIAYGFRCGKMLFDVRNGSHFVTPGRRFGISRRNVILAITHRMEKL
jgi:hypothetical protein